jgi:hypothetical protein
MDGLLLRYRLTGATAAEHAELCAQLTPALAAVRGLVSLTWLSNEATARYGGLYVFEHKTAFNAFVASELYEAIRRQRSIHGLRADDFFVEHVAVPGAAVANAATAVHQSEAVRKEHRDESLANR